jgi:hypothetical protein
MPTLEDAVAPDGSHYRSKEFVAGTRKSMFETPASVHFTIGGYVRDRRT